MSSTYGTSMQQLEICESEQWNLIPSARYTSTSRRIILAAILIFGASHQQATLHTGVLYLKGKTTSFCTISNSLRHDPVEMWAHLEPIFEHAKGTQPQLDTVHFVSDGPTTQCRQNGNFCLMSRIIHRQGFSASSWNFLEAGHGKGAPDGVGGCLKRAADCILAKGQDLPTPFDVHIALQTACLGILLCYVPTSVIEQHGDLPSTLRSAPGCDNSTISSDLW